MSEIERIQDQLRRAYEGSAWHGPSLSELLEGVEAESADARPIPGAHTIRELVLHILAWEKEAMRRLEGHTTNLPDAEDWPQGAGAWTSLVDELATTHARLMEAIGKLDDGSLGDVVGGNPDTVYHLLHGVVQHNLYHGGQIAMLKKAVSQ